MVHYGVGELTGGAIMAGLGDAGGGRGTARKKWTVNVES